MNGGARGVSIFIHMKIHVAIVAVGTLALMGSAAAQWTVEIVSPTGTGGAEFYAGASGVRVGGLYADFWPTHAFIWDPTTRTGIDLNPPGSVRSNAYACDGEEQGGFVCDAEGNPQAAIWHGSAESWVNLAPSDSDESFVWGACGGVQVGSVMMFSGPTVASLWRGTPESWVNLNPAGSSYSFIYGLSRDMQVGRADIAGETHAGFWRGTPESWTDIHPKWALGSEAWDVDGDSIVGTTFDSNYVEHATLWSVSSHGAINLHPSWLKAPGSHARGGCERWQVGFTFDGIADHACIWSGTPDSFVDLHRLLPDPDCGHSVAWRIWREGDTICVAGWRMLNCWGRWDAVIWRHPAIDPCASDFNNDGFVNGDDFDSFAQAFEFGEGIADLNMDGSRTTDDLDIFVDHFELGC